MMIRYDNSIDDMVAFNRYHFLHSPAFRTQRVMYVILGLMIPIGLIGASIAFMGSTLFEGDLAERTASAFMLLVLLGIAGSLSVAWLWLFRQVVLNSLENQVRRVFRQGANKGAFGNHELELTETSLIERTAFNETATKLEAIERLVDAGNLTLIYFGSLTAYVIPRHAVTEGDYDHFVGAVAHRIAGRERDTQHS
jgi:hypothetical protein